MSLQSVTEIQMIVIISPFLSKSISITCLDHSSVMNNISNSYIAAVTSSNLALTSA